MSARIGVAFYVLMIYHIVICADPSPLFFMHDNILYSHQLEDYEN